MRSVGGAGIGFLAWLFGCATVPFDPGRPPPPPEMLPAPPPDPPRAQSSASAGKTGGTAAKTDEPPASEPNPDWDASSRTIRCSDDLTLPVPAGLAVYVHKNGDEITVVPPGAPPSAALIVTSIFATSVSAEDPDDLDRKVTAFSERLDQLGQHFVAILGSLHAIASGKNPDETHLDVRTDDSGIVDAAYSVDDAPDAVWRLLIAQAGPCVFVSVELVRADAAQRFAPMLQRMCAASGPSSKGRSRCWQRSLASFLEEWREAR